MAQDLPMFRGRTAVQQYLRDSNSQGVRSFLLGQETVGVTREDDFAFELGVYEKKNVQGHILEKGSYITLWNLNSESRPLLRSVMITATFS